MDLAEKIHKHHQTFEAKNPIVHFLTTVPKLNSIN